MSDSTIISFASSTVMPVKSGSSSSPFILSFEHEKGFKMNKPTIQIRRIPVAIPAKTLKVSFFLDDAALTVLFEASWCLSGSPEISLLILGTTVVSFETVSKYAGNRE